MGNTTDAHPLSHNIDHNLDEVEQWYEVEQWCEVEQWYEVEHNGIVQIHSLKNTGSGICDDVPCKVMKSNKNI